MNAENQSDLNGRSLTEWPWLEEWFGYESWSADEGIAILVGLHPGQEKNRTLNVAVTDLQSALRRAAARENFECSPKGQLLAQRRSQFIKLKAAWDRRAEKDKGENAPKNYIDWAMVNRKFSIPWLDAAEDAGLLNRGSITRKSIEKRFSNKYQVILSYIFQKAKIDPAGRNTATEIVKELSLSGETISRESVIDFLVNTGLKKRKSKAKRPST